ncbi:hypothetical protein FOA52_015350 [Chlamydomonas sp. UWO 241]|nr:hypothetical protein FOA52_015350 [Chlamydomonas sp. UWO 241]
MNRTSGAGEQRPVRGSSARDADGFDVETSVSRPITVSWIVGGDGGLAGPGPGSLCLCFCPGKCGKRGNHSRLERDMVTDLGRLVTRYGVTTVVNLLSDMELRSCQIRDYAKSVSKQKLAFLHLPIVELDGPSDMGEGARLVEEIVGRMARGEVVAMHCRGGIGRAGMLAACVLLRLRLVGGVASSIAEVRRLRGKTAIESRRQEAFIDAYFQMLQQGEQAGDGDGEEGSGVVQQEEQETDGGRQARGVV